MGRDEEREREVDRVGDEAWRKIGGGRRKWITTKRKGWRSKKNIWEGTREGRTEKR